MSEIRIYELCADSDLVTEFVKYDDRAAIVAQQTQEIESLKFSVETSDSFNAKQKDVINELESQLSDAQKVISVVDSLVTAKGRYHTAQWYQKMVTALDEYKAAIKEK